MQIQDTSHSPSHIAAIVAGNLVPLIGVLFWEWSIFELMFLYWAENVVLGLFTLLLMLTVSARKGLQAFVPSLFMGAFFVFHYGMFCMGHGLFVITLFYLPGHTNDGLFAPLAFIRDTGAWPGFYWALAGMVLVQFIQMLDTGRDLKDENIMQIMMRPYARIIILHLTLIFGGMAVMALGQPIAALILLIILKSAFDLGLIAFIKALKAARKAKRHDTRRNDNVTNQL